MLANVSSDRYRIAALWTTIDLPCPGLVQHKRLSLQGSHKNHFIYHQPQLAGELLHWSLCFKDSAQVFIQTKHCSWMEISMKQQQRESSSRHNMQKADTPASG